MCPTYKWLKAMRLSEYLQSGKACTHEDRQTERERERERERQTDRQTDRQTERETDRQTDRTRTHSTQPDSQQHYDMQ